MGKNLIQKTDFASIPDDKLSKVYITNNIIEAVTIEKPPNSIKRFKRVGRNSCVNLETGEYIEFSNNKNLMSVQNHFRRSAKDLRRIINFNFTGKRNEKFLTLTYRTHMTDYQQVNADFKRFWSKFIYHYSNWEYIRIIEPQESGCWHLHLLIKNSSNDTYFLNYDDLQRLWEHGFLWIENLPFVDNFGAYFSARFTTDEICEHQKSSYKKGKRINFYPSNFKFYTCSKGIKRPKAIFITRRNLKRIVGNSKPVIAYTNLIVSDSNKELNSVSYEQYIIKGEEK